MANASVVKWGHSLALRIPKVVARALGIGEGSEVRLETTNGTLVVVPTESLPEFSDKDFRRGLKMLAASRRKARIATLDLGKPAGREAW
ncbi:MAG TPA: AbrB/MazE/SpoVT family DNA-binding domain-containing protein [Usitatibacter sp.]|jgi:antitoxin component of MazEF toxin-antitoxin module|nr:AbrB/MazE/SpoVT family DNA-binding domain-containing protein [Usitatibacter sp.]